MVDKNKNQKTFFNCTNVANAENWLKFAEEADLEL